MESCGAVKLVKECPSKGIKVKGIVMNDDTSMKTQLGVDTGTDTPGCMTKESAVTKFYTNPSHRKKTYNNALYKLFDSKTAKRLGKYFKNLVSQTRNLLFEEMKKLKMVPLLHSCGDHTIYGCTKDK